MFLGAESAVSNPQLRMQLGPPVPGSSGGAAPALAAGKFTETFERFQRYPVEDQSFSDVGNAPTAYYRDEFVGGETSRRCQRRTTIYAQLFQFKWRSHSDLEQHRFSQQLVLMGQTFAELLVAPGVQPLAARMLST